MAARKKKRDESLTPGDMGPPLIFVPEGGDRTENQANLVKVRQSMGIVSAKELFFSAIERRSQRIILEFSKQSVAGGFDVDGIMQRLPPMDRPTGDLMLAVLKTLANLDASDRRSRQVGTFALRLDKLQMDCSIMSQGTKTGERVLLKMEPKAQTLLSMEDLGMRDKMLEQFKILIGRPLGEELPPPSKGLIILSAPANGGLSTLWRVGLSTTDRYLRDFVCLDSVVATEGPVENVGNISFNVEQGDLPEEILKKQILKQPEVFLFPRMPNRETLDLVCSHILDEECLVFAGVQAKDCAEAVLRMRAFNPNAENFSQSMTAVLNVRLVRRLCERCKQAYRPNPAVLQKLRIPPDRVSTLYREYQPPPPGQEPKRRKGEPEFCPECGGAGYRGRVGIFELLKIDDGIREALVKQPQLDIIRQLTRKAGMRTLQEEGILAVVQGITSLNELQRALK